MKTLETILETYIPAGQAHSRKGRVVLLPSDTNELVLTLHKQLSLVTMTALETEGFALMYVFAVPDSEYFLAPYIKLEGEEFVSLASQIPELGGYERSVYTFFGLTPVGLPGLQRNWLHDNWPEGVYPLRKSFAWDNRPDQASVPYAYKVIEGEGIYEVPVGPVHAGIIEPGHFRFSQAGEEIINLEARLGYVHKGSEKLFEVLPLDQKVRLAERISGDSSFAHSTAFCEAVEQLAGLKVPERGQWLRVLFLELERVANHLNDIAFIMNDTAYTFGGSQGTRLRESILQWHERLSGSRFLRGLNRIGGLSRDVDPALLVDLQSFLKRFEEDFEEVMSIVEESVSMVTRLEGAGVLSQNIAKDLGALGVAARACCLKKDSRLTYPHAVYSQLKLDLAQGKNGDVRDRFNVRVAEVRSSLSLLNQVLSSMPAGSVSTNAMVELAKESFAVTLVEGWRGEIAYLVATDSKGDITRVQPRDPSFMNWPLATFAARGNVILDFPLINKSFNLSYSGNDL